MAYSDNVLLNPSAEFGLSSWETQNVSTALGASKGSYSFKVDPVGYMKQTILFEKSPPDIQFDLDFWLQNALDPVAIDTRAKVLLTLMYSDGTSDLIMYPCKGAPSQWHGIRETITFDTREDVKQLAHITVKIECINFMAGLLIDGLAIRKQEADISDPVDTGKYDEFWETAITYGLDKDKPLLRG